MSRALVPLAALAARRVLSPGLALVALVVVGALAAGARPPAAVLVERGADAAALARGLARREPWIGAWIVLVPLLALRVADLPARWRAGEREWLAARATRPAAIALGTWLGAWLASGAVVLAVALGGELAAGGDGPTWRLAGRLRGLAPTLLADGAPTAAWTLPDPGARAPAGSRVRVPLVLVAGGGPTADVRLVAARVREGERGPRREARARLAGAGTVEVELPPGPGALRFDLERAGAGAVAVRAAAGLELWTPAPSERAAALDLALRSWLALAAALALALGLGAWLAAPLALGALVAAWLPVGLAGTRAAWPRLLPGGDLPPALRAVAEGRLGRPTEPLLGAVTAAAVVLGLALAAAGLRSAGARR